MGDLERQVYSERSAAAAETTAAKARRLEIAAATVRAAVEFGHPHLLDLIERDLGEAVEFEDIAAAAAETASAAEFERSIAGNLEARVDRAAPPPGLPPAGLGHPETLSQGLLHR